MPLGMTPSRHPQLFLHLSNRLEHLADQLADDLFGTASDPMTLRTVVVSSAETSRWLSMQLAERRGLSMGVRYPFLRRVVDELAVAVLDHQRRCSPRFTREAMTWWLFDHLPAFLDATDFDLVRHYLRDGSALRRFELAHRVADLLDQYQVYRPLMLRSWDVHPTEGEWQGHLWRAMRKDLEGHDSFVDLHEAVIARDDDRIDASKLPSSLSIFSVNTIPPSFLDILQKVSGHIRIDLYLLTPTDQYWGDLLTQKQRLKSGLESDDIEGNPLGNSLGKLGRDLQEQLIAREVQQASERFAQASGTSLLSQLQEDFRTLRDRTTESDRTTIHPEDDSLQVHSCHGLMREVEALHDYLLGLFQSDPSLKTRDIIVMAPHIDVYAPYIDAVFGTPESDAAHIPYSLADQSARQHFSVVSTFLKLLELGLSRFETPRVVSLLETDIFRRRFGLTAADLERIRRWIDECGTIWAIDAHHRTQLGYGSTNDFSWAQLEATLLDGYALNGEEPRLRGDVLPFKDLEGDHVDTLDRFLQAFDLLRNTAVQLRTPQSRQKWSESLSRLLQWLTGDEAVHAHEIRAIHSALNGLSTSDTDDHGVELTADVIIDFLDRTLRETPAAGGFLDGRVTFCSLKPMRAIPARVIALLGMNEGEFPRQSPRQAFDYMAMKPQRGDRSLRDDDRYLFLEALLSARDHLYISHIGQSYYDPERSPPSSVVTELLDYIKRAFTIPPPVLARLDIRHRLQAFSRHYFEPNALQSFSAENARAAATIANGHIEIRSLFRKPLAEAGDEWRQVSPTKLAEFFSHPARSLADWRLGIRIDADRDALRTHEPVALDALESYQLQQQLVESAMSASAQPVWDFARARGRLPVGPFGDLARQTVEQKVARFLGTVDAQVAGRPRGAVHVRWDASPWVIDGRIDGVYGNTLLRFRAATLKPRDLVGAWLEHLAVNLAVPGTLTHLIDRDGQLRSFKPPVSLAETEKIIRPLLDLYWQGLSEPLPFFPRTSLAYAKSKGSGMRAALKAWYPDDYSFADAESEDAWISLIHGDRLPLDDAFEKTAHAFFDPLIEHFDGTLP